jgi:hypothetical protein
MVQDDLDQGYGHGHHQKPWRLAHESAEEQFEQAKPMQTKVYIGDKGRDGRLQPCRVFPQPVEQAGEKGNRNG